MAEAMSIAAYKATIREIETPRNIERRIFARITADLEAHASAYDAAASNLDRLGILSGGLSAALNDNVMFWSALKHDLAEAGNQLPPDLRANLISLALWVERQTAVVLGGEAGVAALISTNRAIVAGLAGNAPRPVGAEV
ncbi:flagellar biosynthesis regulator FlaF [Roseibacterium sp. SDUM158017]|uniref:flagellar biosynthesis regulator FlaF n=1 Tax=Roseicyclus salinarum TaxID=3036773 RepID=UPI00241540C0|nr:flagellar biosynthesis regulator FlaF [Roseibacterium sp. SDUM158017]MDG4648641.1 flagellar biosynthesis regulator FlaF [Roseibacterium sp. SDUM158017]